MVSPCRYTYITATGVTDKRDKACRNWTCKIIMILSIAILAIAVGVLGLLLGNRVTNCGKESASTMATTETSLVIVTETATNPLAQAAATYYVTVISTQFVTKLLRETMPVCAALTDSTRIARPGDTALEDTSVASAKKHTAPSRSSIPSPFKQTSTGHNVSKTSGASKPSSSSTSSPTSPFAILHSKGLFPRLQIS